MEAIDIVWVGVGGGVGSVLRWLIERRFTSAFKMGTFLINISGAFVIAYISASLSIGWEHRYGDVISSLVLTGILGGYTTFSTMQLDAVQMRTAGRQTLAVAYLGTSVLVGLIAAAAGVALARV